MTAHIATSVSTETTHSVTVTAAAAGPFLIAGRDETVAAQSVVVKVIVDGTGTLRTVGTVYVARGFAVREDGSVTKAKRLAQGNNLSRLPVEVREAVKEALRETVGALHDPLGQLDGYDGRKPKGA